MKIKLNESRYGGTFNNTKCLKSPKKNHGKKTHPMLTSPKKPNKQKSTEKMVLGDLFFSVEIRSFEADLLDTLGLADLDELPSDPIEVGGLDGESCHVDLGSR